MNPRSFICVCHGVSFEQPAALAGIGPNDPVIWCYIFLSRAGNKTRPPPVTHGRVSVATPDIQCVSSVCTQRLPVPQALHSHFCEHYCFAEGCDGLQCTLALNHDLDLARIRECRLMKQVLLLNKLKLRIVSAA